MNPTPARIALNTLAAGHPKAMEGLREYQKVVEAAIALVNVDSEGRMFDAQVLLNHALREGKFID